MVLLRRTRSARGKLTFREVVVLVGIVGITIAIFLPAQGPPPPLTDGDLDFTSWEPSVENTIQPPENTVPADVNVAGEWMSKTWRRVWLAIEPDRPGLWRVTFRSTTGCGLSKSIVLTRTATYDAGVLTLDRPVQELSGKTYQRFYTVRIHNREYLVPSVRIGKLKNILKGGTQEQQADMLEREYLCRHTR